MGRFTRRIMPVAAAAAITLVVAPGHGLAQSCYDVGVFAGRGVGDGGPGTQAILIQPRNVVLDGAGNVIIADSGNARVRRWDAAAGTVTTIVGDGALGTPADNVPAVLTELNVPSGVALDAAGNLYVADELSHMVLQVTPNGILHHFAGSGIRTGSIDGEGGDATDDLNDGSDAHLATLNHPVRVAVDAGGNLLIADAENHRVRMVDRATGRISTVAGNGTEAPGTAGPATASGFVRPVGLAVGGAGDLYVSDNGAAPSGPTPGAGHQVWKLTAGTLTLVAGTPGTGLPGPAPRAGSCTVPACPPAVGSPLNSPGDLALDASGNLYIGDAGNNVIRRVNTDASIETVVGDGTFDYRDGPAIFARFRHPEVTLTPAGDALVIADTDNNRIRRYDLGADNTTTLVGDGNDPGDGGPAPAAFLQRPTGLTVDAAGNVFVSEHDSHRIRIVGPGGTIGTVVNSGGVNGVPQPGQPAAAQPLQKPTGLGFTVAGDLLIADPDGNQVYRVDAGGHGIISVFAGNGVACALITSPPAGPTCGDTGAAPQAMLNTALRVATAPDGSVYIADFGDHRVRRVDPSGVIATFAGAGFAGQGGDGGAATAARLDNPAGVALDAGGNLYIPDFGNQKVRKVDTGGTISTIAGTGAAGALGDGGAAGAAELNKPTALAFASDGALLVVDQGNNKLRRIAPDASGAISATSTITTVVGDGTPGFKDGAGPVASLLAPTDVAVLPDGRVLIADRGNQRVRVATPGSSCPSATPCASAADCDDGDPCTLDACAASGVCSHAALPPDQCRPSCAAAPSSCIAGGGPRKTDCLAEMFVQGASGSGATVRCRDNDPCDFDPNPGRCVFRIAWCLNEPGCSASGVSKLTARGPAAATILAAVGKLAPSTSSAGAMLFSQLFTTASSCTELVSVPVALRKHGRRPGKLQIRTVAFGTTKRLRDVDKIRLVCVP